VIDQRRQRVFDQCRVVILIDEAGEARGVVTGITDHCQNFAGIRIHRQYHAGLGDDAALSGIDETDAVD
jgi:hypothetical protein